MVCTQIFAVVFVAAIRARQSQNVKTEYECEKFHRGKCKENISENLLRSEIKRWRLHSFDFAFGWHCVLAGKGKCVQCALA